MKKRAKVTLEKAQETLTHFHLLARFQQEGDAPPRIEEIPLERLLPNPYQPRLTFPEDTLAELAQSIQIHGFFGHLIARPKGEAYEIAFGERRFRAAALAGLKTIPVQIQALPNQAMMEIALAENIQREDLHPLEEARAFAQMRDQFQYSVREIGRRVGKSKSYVSSLLSLLRYPDVEEAVRAYDIPVRTAEEIARVEDPEIRKKLIEAVCEEGFDRQAVMVARALSLPPEAEANLSLFPEEEKATEAAETRKAKPAEVVALSPHLEKEGKVEKKRKKAVQEEEEYWEEEAEPMPDSLRILREAVLLFESGDPFAGLDAEQRTEARALFSHLRALLRA